jgi:hypothetical protein
MGRSERDLGALGSYTTRWDSTGSQPPTVFVWLIPQPADEAEYVKQVGWERYEDRLEAEGVDFWSLDRPGLT